MILSAQQIDKRNLPRPQSLPARNGLGYQRKFSRQFFESAPDHYSIITEPWFEYRDSRAPGESLICGPDLIAFDEEYKFLIVIEVKQTWTPLALQKLRDIYCPVVSAAWRLPAKPLVACKRLNPESPRPQSTVSFALLSHEPLIHWIGQGPILW